jgi:hypothetical protein
LDGDQLFVLSCERAHPGQVAPPEVHELQVDLYDPKYRHRGGILLKIFLIVKERWPNTINRIYCSILRPFWNTVFWPDFLWNVRSFDPEAIMSKFWPDFLWNVRSFDPGVIDLRWMRGGDSLRKGIVTELPQILTISQGGTPTRESVDTSWRRYDPTTKVSIVLPVRNGARYLRRSIESCLDQTHRNIELVIVDDFSTDETPNIISTYSKLDSRVRVIRNERNLRLPRALNVGFAHTSGDLLTWTSDDNYYAPTAIETFVRYLSTWPEIDFVYSAFRELDEEGRINPRILYASPPWRLPLGNAVGPCFLYRRSVYEQTGEYRADMEYQEDYEYWTRVYQRFKMMCLQVPLYYYRHRSGSMDQHYRRHPELWGKVWAEHFRSR